MLHQKYPALDRAEDLLPLSLEIARFKIMGARRKIVRRGENSQVSVDEVPLPAGAPDPFELAARQEQIERLEAALKDLGQRCRELFRMKLEGLSFPQIRERLGVRSLNTLYTWDFRCRKQLLERLGGGWEG